MRHYALICLCLDGSLHFVLKFLYGLFSPKECVVLGKQCCTYDVHDKQL